MRKQLNVRIPDTTAQQIAALTEGGYESQAHVIIIAVHDLYRKHQQETNPMQMYLYIHTTDVEHDVDLSMLPLLDGQFVEADADGYLTVVNLAARRDTTAAQEQYLNTHPAVVFYQVVNRRGCANGDGVCPAAIDAAPRNIERGTIIECPHCGRRWHGDYWSERGESRSAWSWRLLEE